MDFPTLEKEVFQREEFYYNKISPKNKKFTWVSHLGCI